MTPWMRAWHRQFDERWRQTAHQQRLAEIEGRGTRERRLEERLTRQLKRGELVTARLLRQRVPIDVRRWQQRELTEELALSQPVPPIVTRNLSHLLGICRAAQIDVRFAGSGNGYAWISLHRIEAPLVRTMYGAATLAHELGHHVTRAAGRVAWELLAWAWARAHLLDWTWDCHDSQRSGLLSYRPRGTVAEHREIDALVSRVGFHRERQRRVMDGQRIA